MVKEFNEITVILEMTREAAIARLESGGYRPGEAFFLVDDYYLPKGLGDSSKGKPSGEGILGILNHAILLRDFGREVRLTHKHKTCAPNGNILEQRNTNMTVSSKQEAEVFLQAIGYEKVMTITDDCLTMTRVLADKQGPTYEQRMPSEDGITDGSAEGPATVTVVVEYVNDGEYLMLEMEENEQVQGIETLVRLLEETGLQYRKDNYFVKKAQLIYERLGSGED